MLLVFVRMNVAVALLRLYLFSVILFYIHLLYGHSSIVLFRLRCLHGCVCLVCVRVGRILCRDFLVGLKKLNKIWQRHLWFAMGMKNGKINVYKYNTHCKCKIQARHYWPPLGCITILQMIITCRSIWSTTSFVSFLTLSLFSLSLFLFQYKTEQVVKWRISLLTLFLIPLLIHNK